METAYLLLGSNMGERKALFFTAAKHLSALGELTTQSSLYETKPWGKTDQPDFLNQVIALKTDVEPGELLRSILNIEMAMGRSRQVHWGPRSIDIDILLIGNRIIETPELTVPHPQLINRRFALVPLAEIAGEVVHPKTGRTIQDHLETCADTLTVNRT